MMKSISRVLRVASAAFFVACALPAAAQWQVPSNGIPVGRGPGTQGFAFVGPCAPGVPFLGAGVSAPPGCGSSALAGMAYQAPGSVNISGGLITGLPSPTNPTDAATKQYADGIAAGVINVGPSALATNGVLPNTPSYSNGTAGVGATLTAGSNTTLTVDATAAPLNTIILVKDQPSAFQNGKYYVSNAGSGAAAWVLTRCTAAACGIEFDGASTMLTGSYTLITAGATNINKAYTLAATVTTPGTTPVNFQQYSAPTQGGVGSINGAAGALTTDDSLRVAGQSLTAAIQLTPYNNYLQNSGMQLAVRQGTTPVAFSSSNPGNITVDRWRYDYLSTSAPLAGQIQQVTDAPPGFVNSVQFTIGTPNASPGVNDVFSWFQTFEGDKTASLGWGTSSAINMSCGWWVKSHRTGQHGGVVKNFDGSQTWAFAYTVISPDTWEYKSTTITGDTSGSWPNTSGSRWGYFLLNIMSGANFQITPGVWHSGNAANATGSVNNAAATSDVTQFTGVMCFAGNNAPTAAQSAQLVRSNADELPRTQRYYQKLIEPPLTGGTLSGGNLCVHMRAPLPVAMMIPPTTVAMTGNPPVSDGPHVDTLSAIQINQSSSTVMDINAVTTTGGQLLGGQPCYIYQDGSSSNFFELYAEP